MIASDDLAAAFEAAGVYGLTIHRRRPPWEPAWVVTARFDGGAKDASTKHYSVTARDLGEAIEALLAVSPRALAKGVTVLDLMREISEDAML